MMVAIRIEGPVACGKTHLVELLKAAIHRNYREVKEIVRVDMPPSATGPAFEELIMEVEL
jgi:deoxyadenosine/deoxycytidine kinase